MEMATALVLLAAALMMGLAAIGAAVGIDKGVFEPLSIECAYSGFWP